MNAYVLQDRGKLSPIYRASRGGETMNIFNRRNSVDDDLPGRTALPKLRLPVEDQIGEMVMDQFAKGPLTLDKRRARLDLHLNEFARHYDAARLEAKAYLEEHDAMITELEAEKSKIEEHLKQLDRIAAGMPQFGGSDEEASSDPSVASDDDPSTGENAMQGRANEGAKPLPFNRR